MKLQVDRKEEKRKGAHSSKLTKTVFSYSAKKTYIKDYETVLQSM